MSKRSRSVSLAMSSFAHRERIQRFAKLQNFFFFQPGIIADIKTVEMHMIDCRIFFEFRLAQESFRIGLAELSATAGCPTTKLDTEPAQGRHHAFTKSWIGFFEH